jgi:hypothetical protein
VRCGVSLLPKQAQNKHRITPPKKHCKDCLRKDIERKLQKEYDQRGAVLKAAEASGDEKAIEQAEGKLAATINKAARIKYILKDTRSTP